jgi:hypothetical protein
MHLLIQCCGHGPGSGWIRIIFCQIRIGISIQGMMNCRIRSIRIGITSMHMHFLLFSGQCRYAVQNTENLDIFATDEKKKHCKLALL